MKNVVSISYSMTTIYIPKYVVGKTTLEILSILDTELRDFSESFIALVIHLKYKNRSNKQI